MRSPLCNMAREETQAGPPDRRLAQVRRQMNGVPLVGGDTMNFWINAYRKQLLETLKLMDIVLINDTEAKQLAGEPSLPRAAKKVLAMGPRALAIKHGEYGATIFFREGAFGIGHHPFRAPALPIDEVRDPTGAGDAFAGGFMGYIASQGELNIQRMPTSTSRRPGTSLADVTSRLSQARISRRPSIGGIAAALPVAMTTARRAGSRRPRRRPRLSPACGPPRALRWSAPCSPTDAIRCRGCGP